MLKCIFNIQVQMVTTNLNFTQFIQDVVSVLELLYVGPYI
jgi:hypothetical protein